MIRRSIIATLLLLPGALSASARAQEPMPQPGHDGGGARGCRPPAIHTLPESEPRPTPQAGPLVIQATYDATINAMPSLKAVIQQAIGDWQATILDAGCNDNPLPIHFQVKPLTNFAGYCEGYYYPSGCVARDTISIDSATNWFIDPTPADDYEFTPACTHCLPPGSYDMLTLVRHEIGHAVGWSSTAATTPFFSGGTFDPTRLNIPIVTATGWHVDPNWLYTDLMTPEMSPQQRRPITLYPDASLVARGFQARIPMHFVDSANSTTGDGSAGNPWKDATVGSALAPAGYPLLIGHGLHFVPGVAVSGTPRVWLSARGGAFIHGTH